MQKSSCNHRFQHEHLNWIVLFFSSKSSSISHSDVSIFSNPKLIITNTVAELVDNVLLSYTKSGVTVEFSRWVNDLWGKSWYFAWRFSQTFAVYVMIWYIFGVSASVCLDLLGPNESCDCYCYLLNRLLCARAKRSNQIAFCMQKNGFILEKNKKKNLKEKNLWVVSWRVSELRWHWKKSINERIR